MALLFARTLDPSSGSYALLLDLLFMCMLFLRVRFARSLNVEVVHLLTQILCSDYFCQLTPFWSTNYKDYCSLQAREEITNKVRISYSH